jgi:hypothetical protein
MIDQAREWLERLHVSNAPEADMALDLLGRLDEAEEQAAEVEQACGEEYVDNLKQFTGLLDRSRAQTDAVCNALGADGPEEAIAMARTLREAFE